ncbi:uncharacterized protein MYCFIDRAFT_89973 [Pseudocercospora fijiensis CIRAD86]|uniref:Steroid 5-alpha reductase C-terminal domain-containing protein n=1 Tax=Pseudocercospora fijiensis (strain CIRAD86) TaxID=383855 RepID=M2YVU1_PSEFD|nr:uncharacterized protein MYCFIDRAFT_89973 [Pseudocercospora fijiensis CIRAD86]EME81810.1 hypothetical protein MYCFIDRAFT_89973 [Pseudocercospora fijiensis CIRAD86]
MSVSSMLKQNYWVIAINRERMLPSFGLKVGLYNFVADTLNTLFFLYGAGIIIEWLSEQQRHHWKKKEENKGQVYMGGLWSLPRHINYFGYTVWRAGYAIAAGGFVWGATIAALSAFRFTQSSIPELQRYMEYKYGEKYREYEKRTPYKSPREIAEQLNDLSIFIREGFCKGMAMVALPCYKHMNHLCKRLHDYAYSIAMTASPRFIPLPDQNTTLDFLTAIQKMEQFATFFQQAAQRLQQSALADAVESALVKDLKIAVQHSHILLGSIPKSPEHADEPHRIFTKQVDSTMWTESKEVLTTVLAVTSPSNMPKQKRERDGDVSPLTLGSPVFRVRFASRSSSAEASDHPQASSRQQFTNAQPESKYLEVPPASNHSPGSSGATTLAGSHTPTDLRPHPHVLQHAPHMLQGPRLESQCGIMDPEVFSRKFDKLMGKSLDSPPDIHRTVQLGHRTPDARELGIYINAIPLELPGIDTIGLTLPLCAREVRVIDYDVLRYVHLALLSIHSFGIGAGGPGNAKEARNVSRALRRSRAIVQREVGSRAFEIEHAKLHPDDHSAHKQSPGVIETHQDWSHVPRGREEAAPGSVPSSHEPEISSPESAEADHKVGGDAENHPSPPLQVFKASIETPIDRRTFLHRRTTSDSSSEIAAPGPAVPPSSHASSEVGIGIIESSEKDHAPNIRKAHHLILARPHVGVQRGSSTGQITPIQSPASQKASSTTDSAKGRRAEAKELDRTRTWSVDSASTSTRGKGDWTTQNHSAKTESSWNHDDWIKKALTPQTTPASEIHHLKSQIQALQSQISNLTTKTSHTAPPPTSSSFDGRREHSMSTSDDKPEWIEQPDPFRGRSSPPYVQHLNPRDGKVYILDTVAGVPEPLDKRESLLRSSRGRGRIEGEASEDWED